MRIIVTALILSVCAYAQSVKVVSRSIFISSDPTAAGPLGWDQVSSWHGSKILYTHWDTGTSTFDMYVINSDGTGNTCISCGLSGIPADTSAGGGVFSPDGSWIVFTAQKSGSAYVDRSHPPGNGSDYDLYLVGWSGTATTGAASKISGATSVLLWPRWNRSSTRITYTQLYAVPDAEHPMGFWQVITLNFNAGGPSVTTRTTCEPIASAGLYETGSYFDDDLIGIMVQAGTGTYSKYNYDLHVMSTTSCENIRQLNDPARRGWYEFPHLEPSFSWVYFTRTAVGAAPVGVNPFCNVGQNTPCSDVRVMDDGGYRVSTIESVIAGCNIPGDPMFIAADVSVFCDAVAWSPDGTQVIIQRQTETGREAWKFVVTNPPTSVRIPGGRVKTSGRVDFR